MRHIKLIVIISVMLLSGCVAIGLQGFSHDDEVVQYVPTKSKNKEWVKSSHTISPDIVEINGEKELLTYYHSEWSLGARRRELAWHGVVLWVVAPIPLLFPTYGKTVYEFNNGLLVKETSFNKKSSGFFIGCMVGVEFVSGSGGAGCSVK